LVVVRNIDKLFDFREVFGWMPFSAPVTAWVVML
jgi:hypothetical protein